MTMHPKSSIGAYVPMVDGPEKVSGRAKYTADLAVQPGTLAARIYRSPYAHAEILDVDVSDALKLPGVRAVITGADCDRTFGVLPIARSEHPLARDKVRYRGEPVAAVAAVDDATAKAAIRLIRVKVRELPAYFSAAEAIAPDALRIHERKRGNIEREVQFEIGDVGQAFAEADLVQEGTYHCPEVCQNQMEMHAALVDYDAAADRLTVHATTQTPYYIHLMMAHVLEMPMSKIRIVKPHVGGGFGARTETLNVELIAALLARRTKGAVRLVVNREETFLTHRGRPESHIRLKIGLRKDGRITGVECDCIQRGGAHSGYGLVTILYAGALLVWRVPRPRHGECALCLREPARPHGTAARPRSARGQACELPGPADLHGQRPDGEFLRLAGVHRLGRAPERLARAAGQASRRPGTRFRVLALCERRLKGREPGLGPERDRGDQARP
jgi:4-hydroxybenzoyl-CoA reductase subunit alpha